jgi:4-amino-4-deoxy-L-arabinose transferase-like glycosyltransferase
MPGKNQYYLLLIPAAAVFTLLMISSTVKPYGFFIDELYFIACAKRPDWGYVDQPPLSLIILAVVLRFFGHSMLAIRFLPALSLAMTVFMTGLLAKRLGGGTGSMLLAAAAVALMPVFLIFCSFYSMNAYEPLIMVSVVYFMVRMIQDDNPQYWLHIGLMSGVGLMMKHTFVLYGLALVIGLLASGKRRLLWSRWILWGGLACFILFLPNLIWQVVNDFPSLELYLNSFTSKNIEKSYLEIFMEQVIIVSPASFPLWITGLIMLFLPKWRPYRFMAFAYIFLLLVKFVGHSSRPDRMASIYPFFMVSGALAMEYYLKKGWRRVVMPLMAVLVIAGGALIAPVFCPLMPPAVLKPYIARLGLQIDIEEGKMGEPVPQWLADRIGWKEMAAEVSRVYQSLPAAEQRNCVIVSDNYGPAGAMELYGSEYGLPPVYATHNSFHSWGPPSDTVKTYIGVDIDAGGARSLFESFEEAAIYYCPDCTRPQREVYVYVMRNPVVSVEKMWPEFKEYH